MWENREECYRFTLWLRWRQVNLDASREKLSAYQITDNLKSHIALYLTSSEEQSLRLPHHTWFEQFNLICTFKFSTNFTCNAARYCKALSREIIRLFSLTAPLWCLQGWHFIPGTKSPFFCRVYAPHTDIPQQLRLSKVCLQEEHNYNFWYKYGDVFFRTLLQP